MSKPNIRFRGYTEDWEQRKLGELGTVQTCKRIFKEQTSEQGDIPFFKNGTIGLKPDSYISREVYEEFRKLYPYPEEGDTLISVVGSIGRTAEYTGKDEYFQDSNVVWLKTDGSINKKFLKTSYQVIKWLIEGSTVKHLYNDNILRSEIVMPSSQIEQAKIASYFESIDNLITLHQRKCEETRKLKKYMLQKMFSQNEKKFPEIRFQGFTEDWEQRKVGDISESYSGGTPTAGKKEYYDGDIPFIRSGEISGDKTELFITDEGLNNSSAKMVKIGDILYALYGATSGEVSISKLKGAINQAILAIHPHEDYDSQFLMQWLRKSKENIIGTYLQGGQGNLSGNIVKQLLIDVPTYEEQKKIGAYFEYLDNLITLHQQKYEELQKIKKFMLQNMFV